MTKRIRMICISDRNTRSYLHTSDFLHGETALEKSILDVQRRGGKYSTKHIDKALHGEEMAAKAVMRASFFVSLLLLPYLDNEGYLRMSGRPACLSLSLSL